MKRRSLIILAVMTTAIGAAAGYAAAVATSADFTETQATLVVGLLGISVTIAAVVVAIWAIKAQHHSARAQHTINHLAATERDQDILEAKQAFVERAARPGGLAKYAHKEGCKTERQICTVLNHFELISLGIQCRIIDFEIFKRWNHSTVLFVWAAAAPFVTEMRKQRNSPMLWHEFEELAREFNTKKRPPRQFH